MGEIEKKVKAIEVKPKKGITVIKIPSSPEKQEDEEVEQTLVRPCVKRKMDLSCFEEKKDCFILDFDPDDTVPADVNKFSADVHDANDLFVIAKKGQVHFPSTYISNMTLFLV